MGVRFGEGDTQREEEEASMKLDVENSKAQITTSGPCCKRETINADDFVSEASALVNADVQGDPGRVLTPAACPAENRSQPGHTMSGDDVFAHVTRYIKAGVSLFPCKPDGKEPLISGGFKGATRDMPQAEKWWRNWPQARAGIPTGDENGFFVLDVDLAKGDALSGAESLASLEARFGKLPQTYTVRTLSGGEHRYFKMPQGGIKNSAGKIGAGLDIRGDGGYVIAAGSRGYTALSGRFEELADAPEWLIQLCQGRSSQVEQTPNRRVTSSRMAGGDGMERLRVLADDVKNAIKGQRHVTILAKANAAGRLVRDGLVTRAQAISQLRRAVSCLDYTPEEREVEFKTVEDGVSYALGNEDSKPKRGGTAKVSQPELIEMVKHFYGENNLISDGGRIYFWRNDGIWRPVPKAELKQRMSKMLGKSATNGVVKNTYELALSDLYSPAFVERQEQLVINCRNGELTWTGDHWQFEPSHQRERYALSQLPVEYDPSATCTVFDEYLDSSFGHENEGMQTRQLLLEMAGYTLLPTCHLQKFGFLYGPPGSGKSVFLDLLAELVGVENHTTVMLSDTANDSKRSHLQGKLLHTNGDLDPKASIPVGILKSLTSGDVVSARVLYGETFNMRPTTTLWIASNSLPPVADFKAIKRRVALIEFSKEIPAERQDKHLIEKLKAELPGILNRVLGAFGTVLKRNGMFTEPDNASKLFKVWNESADDLTGFIKECCILGDDKSVSSGELYTAYDAWAKSGNVRYLVPKNKLAAKLNETCRVEPCRSGKVRKLRGIALAKALAS